VGLDKILRHAFPILVQRTEQKLGIGMSLDSGFLEPLLRVDIVWGTPMPL
jgi:hypothetical protein